MKKIRQCPSCRAWDFIDPNDDRDVCGRCHKTVTPGSEAFTAMDGAILIGILIVAAVLAAAYWIDKSSP